MVFRKRLAATLAMLAIALAPATALAEEQAEGAERVAEIAFDLVILRPAGFARVVLGAALLWVALPFAYVSGNSEEVMEKLVGEPGKYTFRRALGDF